jgi:hypothetical protein
MVAFETEICKLLAAGKFPIILLLFAEESDDTF